MKYKYMLLAALITPFFISYNGMAAEAPNKANVEIVKLSKYCQECLLHCAKDRQFGEFSLEQCAKEVCMDVCKTQEKK